MITNKFNLPDPIFRAVNKQYPPKEDRFSVTDLIGPAAIRQLKMKHWDELTEDASERLWALLGQAVDGVLTKYAQNAIVQEKLEFKVDGATVVAKPDLYLPDQKRIEDWKVTSVWSFVLGDRSEWVDQLNCYAWAERKADREVASLGINAILRDWSKSKTRDEDYPRIPFAGREISLWTFEKQENYIKEQLYYHRMSKMPECTSKEKWEKPTTYAVMKKGRKSALRVLGNRNMAKQWCINNDYAKISDDGRCLLEAIVNIVERPGECIRCKSYCPVRKVCPFNKEK